MSKQSKFYQHLKDFAWLIKKDGSSEPPDSGPNWPERIDVKAKAMAELIFPEQPDPEPDPFPEPVREIQGHFLSLWEWFKRIAWDGKKEAEALYELRRTVRKAREYRVSLIDGFFFVSDAKQAVHKQAGYRGPWVVENDVHDLERYNLRFWDLFEKFLIVFKEEKVHFMPQLAMGRIYNLWPFQSNKQGVYAGRIHDPVTVPYFVKLANMVGRYYAKVYGDEYTPFIKPGNEFFHRGDCRVFHNILYWHKHLWDRALSNFTDRSHIVADITGSEASRGPFVERGECPRPECCPEPDLRHGVPNDGKPLRVTPPEVHGCSTIHDFKGEIEGASHNHIVRYTEDGGSRTRTGKGHTWAGLKANWANADQTYEAGKYLWTVAKDKKKTFMFALFPIETLDPKTEKADYRVEAIDWERFEALRRAWNEVME